MTLVYKQIAVSGSSPLSRFISTEVQNKMFNDLSRSLSPDLRHKLDIYLAWKLLGTIQLRPEVLFLPNDLMPEQELQVKRLLEITSLAAPSNRNGISNEHRSLGIEEKTKESEIVVIDFNPEEMVCLQTLRTNSPVYSCAISPDSKILAAAVGPNGIKIWDAISGEYLKTLNKGYSSGESLNRLSIAISPDSTTLVSNAWDKIKIWDLASGNCLKTIEGHRSRVTSVAISPNGKTLASGSDDYTIKIWDLPSGNLLKTLSGHHVYLESVAISPDSKTLVSGDYNHAIKIWDLARGKCLKTLKKHSRKVNELAISPDSRTLASGSDDKTIKIWDLVSGKCLKTLEGHLAEVRTVAISPDGRTLVSGSVDKTIKIWDLASGNCLTTLSGHKGGVNSLAFGPDGQTLVSGSNDNTVKIWGNP